MENKNCSGGCETDSDDTKKTNNYECTETSKQEETQGCGCSSEVSPEAVEEDNECGYSPENPEEMGEEDDGCGCGCGVTEYPDQSQINNPAQPKFMADNDFINELEKYAYSIGIKGVGYTQITPELLIKDTFVPYPHAIVLTMEMGQEILEKCPGEEAHQLNDAAYARLGKLTYLVSDYLREHGFATQVAHPYESKVNFTPLAQKAGLGWIGKSGLLISPDIGPGQKISAIIVSIANLPEKDPNTHSWVSDYCKRCSNCIKACPEKAMLEKEGCCGNKETVFEKKLCIGCSQGCTYCIQECPFHTKGYDHIKTKFDKMNDKLRERNKNKCC